MNILIINWRDIKNNVLGGSEIYFYEIAKRFAENGHKVTWLTSRNKNKKIEYYEGLKIIRIGNKWTTYFLIPLKYLFSLKHNFDVIVDVENGIPFFSPFYKKNKNTKVILHIHHIHKEVWFRELPLILAKIGWFLEGRIMSKVYKNSGIITLSESSKKEILKNKIKIKSEEVFVVNPGIKKYKLKNIKKTKEPSILFLNRIKKYKGVKTFLRAVKSLQDQDIKFNTLVAGTGDDLNEMKDYAKKLKIKNIKFLGRVSEQEKIKIMQESWVFINPSMKEGWGIVNIEANYCGTPVIGSNVAGIKDSVLENKSGLLFEYNNVGDLANKIKEIIKNKKLRDNLSKESKKWANKFSWEKSFKDYESAINKILKIN